MTMRHDLGSEVLYPQLLTGEQQVLRDTLLAAFIALVILLR